MTDVSMHVYMHTYTSFICTPMPTILPGSLAKHGSRNDSPASNALAVLRLVMGGSVNYTLLFCEIKNSQQ